VRVETIGLATLYLADNIEVMPHLRTSPFRIAALIGDPPYGQKQNTNVVGPRGQRAGQIIFDKRRKAAGALHSTSQAVQWPDAIHGDNKPFDPSLWLDVAPIVLLWGAHKFADRLPAGSWLIWDKVPTGKIRDQGDGEAAWLSGPPRPLRIHRLLWDGVCVGSAARHEVTAGQPRVHPTQKPESLMAWCIVQARVPPKGIILDPWMGAGSTGVAAVRAGYPFVGIEYEALYFETACRRMDEAQRQGGLFADAAQ
jgi:site-specific DNA-methyltransferase (adenine-specific)/modification methylase